MLKVIEEHGPDDWVACVENLFEGPASPIGPVYKVLKQKLRHPETAFDSKHTAGEDADEMSVDAFVD